MQDARCDIVETGVFYEKKRSPHDMSMQTQSVDGGIAPTH